MNLLEKIIYFLSYELPNAPKPYGWFHILFLLLTIVVSVLVVIKYKNANEKQSNRLLLVISIIMLTFELYKQLQFSFNGTTWFYQWYAFPFQFCSVPMYISLITSLLKDGKLKQVLYNFLGTFCLFAGLAVMLYPNDVFIRTLGISIQTMVHHGLMVVIGLFTIMTNKVKLEHKSIISSGLVFIVLVSIAFLLNITFRNVNGTFNMFFIGPYYPNHLPILSTIQQQFGYFPFIIAYVLGFILVAYLILLIAIAVSKLSKTVNVKYRLSTKNGEL